MYKVSIKYFQNFIPRPARENPKYTNLEILREEGDLVDIYSSKNSLIPQIMPNEALRISRETQARIYEDDLLFFDSLRYRDFLGPNTYYIVDIGHAHLPGLLYFLADAKIDCSFMIPGSINPRFSETAKYWAGRVKEAQEKIGAPLSYATLIDSHRTYSLGIKHFPSAELLLQLGIYEVLYFIENKFGQYDNKQQRLWSENILKNYDDAGIRVYTFGIDIRH